uniref:Uncharacterized protein n=1 Tax=Arion vulgaris TaxID=1028688 RepID=A0A0B7AXN7_9EUPU
MYDDDDDEEDDNNSSSRSDSNGNDVVSLQSKLLSLILTELTTINIIVIFSTSADNFLR